MEKRPAVEQVFHALGDPTRRKIVARISRGPISVSLLAQPLEISLAAVVQHLQVLEESGLVKTEKSGRVRVCSLNPAGFSVAAEWISAQRNQWEKGLDRLAELLAEDDGKA